MQHEVCSGSWQLLLGNLLYQPDLQHTPAQQEKVEYFKAIYSNFRSSPAVEAAFSLAEEQQEQVLYAELAGLYAGKPTGVCSEMYQVRRVPCLQRVLMLWRTAVRLAVQFELLTSNCLPVNFAVMH
jgi:hypothetical protein